MATAHTNLKPDEPAKSDYTLTASDNPIDESLHLGSHQQGRGRSGKHFIDSENNANIASSSFDINVARGMLTTIAWI